VKYVQVFCQLPQQDFGQKTDKKEAVRGADYVAGCPSVKKLVSSVICTYVPNKLACFTLESKSENKSLSDLEERLSSRKLDGRVRFYITPLAPIHSA
jgi:hypothetical protein